MELMGYPLLDRRFGNLQVFTGTATLWPISFAAFPVVGALARWFVSDGAFGKVVLWVGLLSQVLLGKTAALGYV